MAIEKYGQPFTDEAIKSDKEFQANLVEQAFKDLDEYCKEEIRKDIINFDKSTLSKDAK